MGTNNEAETIKKNEYNYYIWIDPNINNKENTEYAKTLLKFYKNLLLFTKIGLILILITKKIQNMLKLYQNFIKIFPYLLI